MLNKAKRKENGWDPVLTTGANIEILQTHPVKPRGTFFIWSVYIRPFQSKKLCIKRAKQRDAFYTLFIMAEVWTVFMVLIAQSEVVKRAYLNFRSL